MAPRPDHLGQREGSIPHPPPRGVNLKSLEPGNCLRRGGGARGRRDPRVAAGAGARRVPGDHRGSGQGARAAEAAGPRLRTPCPAAAAPGGPRSPPRGAPPARRAHAPRAAPRPAERRRRGRRGEAPRAARPPAPRAPAPPRPGPPAAARKTLHSPEFLHVCGRGLRETKREGQRAGGVRSAAAPGGAGHRGHRRRGGRAPCAARSAGSPARATPGPTADFGPRDSVGAPGSCRVTGEPSRATAPPRAQLRPPGVAGD